MKLTKYLTRIRLLHAGLLLIVLTLSIEIISLSLIGNQLLSANRELWLQMRKYHCVAASNKVVELIYRASNELFIYGLFHRDKSLSNYEKYVSRLKRQGEFGWELAITSPRESVFFLQTVHELSEKALNRLDDVRQTFQMTESAVFSDGRVIDRARDTLLEFVTVMKEIADLQLSYTVKLKQSDWRITKNLITTVFVLNALLTSLAVLIWVRGVTARIGLLVESCRRLGRGAELLPQEGGTDELATLERSFHEAAAKLREDDEQRREIIAVISHELRSPLTAISSTLTMATDGFYGELEKGTRQTLQTTDQELNRLLQLINELLDISKQESGKANLDLQEYNLSESIEVVLDETKDLLEAKHINVLVKAPALKVNADSSRIERVLMTLLTCLANLSSDNATITISTERHSDQATVRVANETLLLPPELMKVMFTPSRIDAYQLPERLSLLLSKNVIEQHYGTIGAECTAGKGTTFWFSIPVTQLRRLVRFTSIELSDPQEV